jgi:arylsulfatase A-like enzyme
VLAAGVAPPPNIVVILADDLGYGDVQCLNPGRGKIPTPNLDRLAVEGMVFTDAHSSSAVCTPSRYGLLTGRHAWRTRLHSGVPGGFAPPLIEKDRLTLPAFLKQRGYATACIGKWHLGMTWPRTDAGIFGDAISSEKEDTAALHLVDWEKPVRGGPLDCGFDSFFGISASLDMPPFVFLRGDKVTRRPDQLKTWLRTGPAADDFEAIDVLPKLVEETRLEIRRRAAGGKPFFLYVALTSPHTPILPADRWRGKSGLGPYADFVMATDQAVGDILAAIGQAGVSGNTLVIATSDNGCSPAAGTERLEQSGHFASAWFRGYKSDIWEGGHRVPFLVRWPERIPSGSRCARTICLNDLFATCADILGATLPENAAEDSNSILPALFGKEADLPTPCVIHHSIDGSFAIRRGRWKLALCPGSGGWGKPDNKRAAAQGLPDQQLYDLAGDPGETKNLIRENPGLAENLSGLLHHAISSGRTRPAAANPPHQP